jgi:hypothetical protein
MKERDRRRRRRREGDARRSGTQRVSETAWRSASSLVGMREPLAASTAWLSGRGGSMATLPRLRSRLSRRPLHCPAGAIQCARIQSRRLPARANMAIGKWAIWQPGVSMPVAPGGMGRSSPRGWSGRDGGSRTGTGNRPTRARQRLAPLCGRVAPPGTPSASGPAETLVSGKGSTDRR